MSYYGSYYGLETDVQPSYYKPILHNYIAESVVTSAYLTVNDIKTQIRQPLSDTTEDSYLLSLVSSAISVFESITGQTLLKTTFKTYRDSFNSRQFVLTRSKFISLTSFKYLKAEVLTDVPPSIYYTTNETYYSRIILKHNNNYPCDIDNRKQAIEIIFTAGLSDDSGIYPADIKLALLQMITQWYFDRGDCEATGLMTNSIPSAANAILSKYKILNLTSANYKESTIYGSQD